MEQVEAIWDTGEVTDWFANSDEVFAFRQRSGSKKVVAIRWSHRGRTHQFDRPERVLPDLSGVVLKVINDERTEMSVINADGSERFSLTPPAIDDRLDECNANLESVRPGWPSTGIELGVYAAYPTRQQKVERADVIGVILEIDWGTGTLHRWMTLPPWV